MYLGYLIRDGGPADELAKDAEKGFPKLAETANEYGPAATRVAVTAKTGNPAIGEVAAQTVRKATEAWKRATKSDD